MNGSSIGTHTAGRPVAGLPGMGSASRRRKKPAPVKKATKPTAVGATKAIEKKKATSRSVKPASKWRDWQTMATNAVTAYYAQLKGLLAKSDGKDKALALLQYAAMFTAGGEPGYALGVQKSLASARKPFRFFKPVEIVVPLLHSPPKGKGLGLLLQYVKAIGMTCYFVGDHLVWAGQAGLMQDKDFLSNMGKLSLWGWFGGSASGMALQTSELTVGRGGFQENIRFLKAS